MKRLIVGLTLVIGLVSSTGCNLLGHKQCNDCSGPLGCRPCKLGWQRGGTDYQHGLGGHQQAGLLGKHHPQGGAAAMGANGPGGPATAQVAYPYYTNRGPRDFLSANPPSIGE